MIFEPGTLRLVGGFDPARLYPPAPPTAPWWRRHLWRLCALLALIVGLMILFAVLTAVAAAEIAPAPAVDFTPIVDYFVYAALSAVSLGVMWGIRKLNRVLNLRIDDQMAARATIGLTNGLRKAYEKYKPALLGADGKAVIEIRSALLREGAAYALKHYPDALRHFDIERPEQLGEMAAALLPKIEQEQGPRPPDGPGATP